MVNNGFMEGGEGAVELAHKVVRLIDEPPSGDLTLTYDDNDTVKNKIEKVAKNIYGAATVSFSDKALKKLKLIEDLDLNNFPICIAKTQYSFSADAKAYGVAKDFDFKINNIVINRGAEFIVAIAGEIMRMPGLPKVPQANFIDIVDGHIEGLS